MDPQQTGLDAQQIINSTVYKNAVSLVQKAVMNSIQKTPFDGTRETSAKLDHYYAMLRVMELTHNQLTLAIAQGKVEEKKIERIGKRSFTL